MRHLAFEVRGKVDNVNCRKGALLHADTASDAKAFGDEGNLRFWRDFDA